MTWKQSILRGHVQVSTSVDFGENGLGFLRFSYANSLDNITEGLARIEWFMKGKLKN